jgi:hypothetical protein
MLGLVLGPYVGLVMGGPLGLRPVCAAVLGSGLLIKMAYNGWIGRRAWPVLLFPLGAAVLSWFFLRSGLLALRHGGVRWRGTFYSTEDLKAHSRLELL